MAFVAMRGLKRKQTNKNRFQVRKSTPFKVPFKQATVPQLDEFSGEVFFRFAARSQSPWRSHALFTYAPLLNTALLKRDTALFCSVLFSDGYEFSSPCEEEK